MLLRFLIGLFSILRDYENLSNSGLELPDNMSFISSKKIKNIMTEFLEAQYLSTKLIHPLY